MNAPVFSECQNLSTTRRIRQELAAKMDASFCELTSGLNVVLAQINIVKKLIVCPKFLQKLSELVDAI